MSSWPAYRLAAAQRLKWSLELCIQSLLTFPLLCSPLHRSQSESSRHVWGEVQAV